MDPEKLKLLEAMSQDQVRKLYPKVKFTKEGKIDKRSLLSSKNNIRSALLARKKLFEENNIKEESDSEAEQEESSDEEEDFVLTKKSKAKAKSSKKQPKQEPEPENHQPHLQANSLPAIPDYSSEIKTIRDELERLKEKRKKDKNRFKEYEQKLISVDSQTNEKLGKIKENVEQKIRLIQV